MEYTISDLCALCCPEGVEYKDSDSAAANRIKAMVREKLGEEAVRPGRMRGRTVLIAAVIAALLTTAAFAVSSFILKRDNIDTVLIGHLTERDEAGNIIEQQKFIYPDAGLYFSFEGSAGTYAQPEYRCFWLPEGCSVRGQTDREGWTDYLIGQDEEGRIAFLIEAFSVNPRSSYVLNGKTEIISDEEQDGWRTIKVVSDYRGTGLESAYKKVNYIFMFNARYGYFLNIGGESDMETLQRIADGIELRESNIPPGDINGNNDKYSESVGILDIGLG